MLLLGLVVDQVDKIFCDLSLDAANSVVEEVEGFSMLTETS